MTPSGAQGWYFICERLRARHPPLSLRPAPATSAASCARIDFDIDMADTPLNFPLSAGKKRSRDDDDDYHGMVGFQHDAPLEKVRLLPHPSTLSSSC